MIKKMKNSATQAVRSPDSKDGTATNCIQMIQDSNSMVKVFQAHPE
jgi:hypothetical protein